MGAFDKVIGYEGVKLELRQIADMLKHPARYTALGAEIPRGVLLYGNPGVGKTLMATALMDEAGVETVTVRRTKKDSEIVDDITGAFAFAKANAPAIILLDDMDKFANEDEDHPDVEEYVTIQTCIDELGDANVLVAATVNSINKLPGSLTRAGRFDCKIHIDSPTDDEAVSILRHYLEDKPVVGDIDVRDISKMVNTDTGTEIRVVLNKAASIAGFEQCERIEMRHFVEAVLRIYYGGPSKQIVEADKTKAAKVACHEAAHLVVSESLMPGSIGFALIGPGSRGSWTGSVYNCFREIRRPHHIMICLAGKVATEMRFSGIASGCCKDLREAVGAITDGLMYNATRGFSLQDQHKLATSESYYLRMESAVNVELERYTIKVRDILLKNSRLLDRVAEELMQKQYLLFSDIQRLKDECGIVGTETLV